MTHTYTSNLGARSRIRISARRDSVSRSCGFRQKDPRLGDPAADSLSHAPRTIWRVNPEACRRRKLHMYIYTHAHAHIYLSIYLSIYTQAPPAFRLPPWLYIYIPSHTHTNISIYLPTVCMYTYIPVAALLCEKNISRAPLTQTLAPRAFRLPPWLYIIYTYPHTHTHTHSHTHIYIYVCTHPYMYIYIHVYIYRSIDLSIYVSISISIVYV